MVYKFLNARVKTMFYKLNVHAGRFHSYLCVHNYALLSKNNFSGTISCIRITVSHIELLKAIIRATCQYLLCGPREARVIHVTNLLHE